MYYICNMYYQNAGISQGHSTLRNQKCILALIIYIFPLSSKASNRNFEANENCKNRIFILIDFRIILFHYYQHLREIFRKIRCLFFLTNSILEHCASWLHLRRKNLTKDIHVASSSMLFLVFLQLRHSICIIEQYSCNQITKT